MTLEIDRESKVGVSVVSDSEIESLLQLANSSHKKRAVQTLQRTQDERVDRIIQAILPDSYIRPYKYKHSGGVEMLLPLSGIAELLTFSDEGKVTRRVLLKRGIVCDIESDVFRSVIAGTPFAVFELSTHPLVFGIEKERISATWAPEEGSPGAERYLESLRAPSS